MPEDRIASFRANNQRAIAALEAVAAYAQTRPWQTSLPPRRTTRSGTTSACPGCCADYGTSATSSTDSVSTRSAVPRTNSTSGPGPPCQPRPPGRRLPQQAIDIYELVRPPRCGGRAASGPWTSWRSSTATRASRGISREAAVARLTSGLVASLRQYADHQGLDFSVGNGRRAPGTRPAVPERVRPHRHRARPERRRATTLSPAAAPPFEPVVTHQGVVTAFGDAEWLLIRTAARIERRNSADTSPRTVILMTAAR